MLDFMSIGEILIDFAPFGDKKDNTFQQNPGGAPANVAAVLAKLGLKTAFVGKIGNDPFGMSCKNALDAVGVSTQYMPISDEFPTTLAFVCLDENGNREFSFYRDNTADVNLNLSDIEKIKDIKAKFFHFGAVALTAEPSKSTVIAAVKQAKENGDIITYDPNLRLPLWKSEDEARKVILDTIKYADILKISEEEALFLFGTSDCEAACKIISELYHTKFVIITRGKYGCMAMINKKFYPSYAYDLKTIDTTGAGDSFFAGILFNLLETGKNVEQMTDDEIEYMFDFANATGSLVTTKKGAIPAVPSLEEIKNCMKNEPYLKLY